MKRNLIMGAAALVLTAGTLAAEVKGLSVLVTSGDTQTQTMAMSLSTVTMKKHQKKVNIVLCGPAGILATKAYEAPKMKRPNGTTTDPKNMLVNLVNMGAKVEVCPLYLPNAGQKPDVLIKGVSVAKPPMVAADLLNPEYQNISF